MGEDAEPTPEPGEQPGVPGEPKAGKRHAPTAPWYGAIVTVSLFLAAGWLLAYTLLDWDWQQRWGAWNYLIALVLSSIPGRMLQYWHGEPHRE